MAIFRVFEGNKEAAEKEFIAALDENPRNAFGLKQYGRFLFNNGRVEQGMELITAAVEIEPYSVTVLWEQCQTNAYLQNFEISLAACDRINEIAPESPSGWYGWALAHMYSGDIARGAKGYSEAIKRDPGDFEMIAAMAQFWLMLGDVDQAEQWLERAEAIGAGQPIPTISRLMLLRYREQHDRVRDLTERTLALKADDRHGSQFTLRRTWAYEQARIGDYQAALKPFRESSPWAFEAELVLPDDLAIHTGDAIRIAALLKLSDPTSERPEQLLNGVESVIGKQPPNRGAWSSDLKHAAVATIRGDNKAALQWLNGAWDKKWRLGWRTILLGDVVFSQLKNEPGYQELAARFEADMERQRSVAYELLEIQK
jgi:Tfp pilus assembly protein PilF